MERGEKWGMNIWLRERAPAGGGGGDAHRDAPPPPPPAPPGMVERCAAGCESEATPLGLCLCDAQYEPSTLRAVGSVFGSSSSTTFDAVRSTAGEK